MTYPNSSPIRRSARGARGFQPGIEPSRPEPFRPRTRAAGPPARPANSPLGGNKLERYLARGKWLARASGVGIALEVGWGIGNAAYEWWYRRYYGDPGSRPAPPITEYYRQPNVGNVPLQPYPIGAGGDAITHKWHCPDNWNGNGFWKGHTTWNDGIPCLIAQAQFATAASVWVGPKFSVGSAGVVGYDGYLPANWVGWGPYHYILWSQYCVGVGCATSRTDEAAHIGKSGNQSRAGFYAGSPWWFPAVEPAVSPALNPHNLPINVPVTTPKPMPYRAVPYMPVFDPFAPGATPLRGPVPARAISPSPSPWQNGIVVRPGQPVQPAPPHVRRPPVKGEKERKPGRDMKRAIDPIVGPITEGVDAIDAVYDALPWDVRKGAYRRCRAAGGEPRECMTPQKKLKVIYDNADRLDMAKVIENLAKNHLEDRVIGELSRRADKNLRDRGWHDTFGRGPTSGPAL